jgi:hypothetical protein
MEFSMRRVSKLRWLFVAVALGAVLPSAGEAQLGGLKKLKARVEKAVGGEEPAAETPKQDSPYNRNTLEITPEVAACFERALAAENAALDEFRAWASKVKTEDEYQSCQGQAMMSPEGQAISQAMVAAAEKGEQAAMQAVQVAQQKLQALTEKTCGPQPRQVEERRREAQKLGRTKGMETCGYTEQQYSILKERILPICRSATLAAADGALRLPGDTSGMYYVYSAGEVEVLKARCGRLMGALQKQL